MASKTATIEKIGRVGQRRQVMIPREILETLNIHEGDFVAITRKMNAVLIKAKRLVDDDTVFGARGGEGGAPHGSTENFDLA